MKKTRRRNAVIAAGVFALAAMGPAGAYAADEPDLLGAVDGLACAAPVSQPFLEWGDTNLYQLAPGGDFAGDTSGWSLEDGAAVAEGALSITDGSSATSAGACVGPKKVYTHMRFMAANDGDPKAKLTVEAIYRDKRGNETVKRVAELKGDNAFSPTKEVKLPNSEAKELGSTTMQFRFTPQGGNWRIDDVYIDPRCF